MAVKTYKNKVAGTHEEKKAKTVNKIEKMNIGTSVRVRDMPAPFSAVSSECSPKFPYVINEESKTASGKETGVILILKYPNS